VTSRHPRLLPLDDLPTSVLVVATHPDDEMLGCGGSLALHARRGDRVRVLIVSDGGDGARRAQESRAAAKTIGVEDLVFLDLPDGRVGHEPQLVAWLEKAVIEADAELVYAPSPGESHPDHRAVARALLAATAGRPSLRLRLYGTNRPVPANALLDISEVSEAKDTALACFASQLEAQDLIGKARAFDQAWTINADDPQIVRAEGFVELQADRGQGFAERAAVPLAVLASAPPHLQCSTHRWQA
jgi:LmbE family N-acetylglucosaminyl deacetylase